MSIEKLTKQKRKEYPDKMPTLKRIKAGKVLMVIAAIPLGTSWMALIGGIMLIPVKPTLWAKDKLRHYMQGRQFK